MPPGLKGYYEHHWRKMRINDEEQDWHQYREPIISYLAVARESVSAKTLSKLTGLPEHHVQIGLKKWKEFLLVDESITPSKYRIYHNSFREFLKKKNEIGELDLYTIEAHITDVLRQEWESMKKTYIGKK